MQTFFGSVKKPAYAKATARQAQGYVAAFASDAALFHAAEGDAQVAHQPAIHPNSSGVNLLRDPMRAIQVLGRYERRRFHLRPIPNKGYLLWWRTTKIRTASLVIRNRK